MCFQADRSGTTVGEFKQGKAFGKQTRYWYDGEIWNNFYTDNGLISEEEIKDQNQQLQKMYGITGFPTIIVMDANGKPILQLGYEDVSPDVYAAKIESAIKKSQTLLKTN